MPYLVRVGRIDTNLSTVGSRGYAVFRKGTQVVVQYGKIEAIGRLTTRFYWCWTPNEVIHKRRSVTEAARLAARLVAKQLQPNSKGRYQKLRPGVRIRSHRRRPV